MTKFLTLAIAAATIAAVPVQAATFDVAGSYDGVNNPAGAFTFGYIDPALTTFTPFATSGFSTCIPNVSCLNGGGEPALGAYKNLLGVPFAFDTINIPADALFLHPGPSLLSAIVFTAPTTAVYNFTFSAALLSNSTITGTQLFSGFLSQGNIIDGAAGPSLTALNPSFGIAGSAGLIAAGDGVFVAVGPAGDFTFDSTQISFTLSNVPEPASWALLIAGFGLTGAALRRRRAVTIAA